MIYLLINNPINNPNNPNNPNNTKKILYYNINGKIYKVICFYFF